MKAGDRVVFTGEAFTTIDGIVLKEPGDTATLTRCDDDGIWWADFDDRDYGHIGYHEDKEFCVGIEGLTFTKIPDMTYLVVHRSTDDGGQSIIDRFGIFKGECAEEALKHGERQWGKTGIVSVFSLEDCEDGWSFFE